MIVETFHPGKGKEIYQRVEEKGRLMPEGLMYIDSWIDKEVSKCFQLMETQDFALLEEWIGNWKDLADFEIIEVISSEEARNRAKTEL